VITAHGHHTKTFIYLRFGVPLLKENKHENYHTQLGLESQKVEFTLWGLLKFEFQPTEPFVIMEGELKRQTVMKDAS
jgi:hypothetical protein